MKKRIISMSVFLLGLWNMTLSVYASSGSSAITQPFNTLQTLVADFVTGIGAIVVLFGIFEFGNAQQTQDGSAKTYALQRIGGGIIMLVAPQLLQLFT